MSHPGPPGRGTSQANSSSKRYDNHANPRERHGRHSRRPRGGGLLAVRSGSGHRADSQRTPHRGWMSGQAGVASADADRYFSRAQGDHQSGPLPGCHGAQVELGPGDGCARRRSWPAQAGVHGSTARSRQANYLRCPQARHQLPRRHRDAGQRPGHAGLGRPGNRAPRNRAPRNRALRLTRRPFSATDERLTRRRSPAGPATAGNRIRSGRPATAESPIGPAPTARARAMTHPPRR
jgi:hypothetical protein